VRTRFGAEELLQSHAFDRPHEAGGRRFHGGFDSLGRYRSPRTRWRRPAITAWARQLKAEGQTLLRCPASLFGTSSYPSAAQQAYLLEHGLGRPFYDALTRTAEVECKAGRLRAMQGPDFRALVQQEIDQRALGHLDHGLLAAHGLDEAGDPATPTMGGHDQMWLTARDMLFDGQEYETTEGIIESASVSSGMFERQFQRIPQSIELALRFFMNVLLSEIRAESMFDFCDKLLARHDVFGDRPGARQEARMLIHRIRCDEISHVGYLRVMLSELRAMRWTTEDGGTIDGREVIDPLWETMLEQHNRLERDAEHSRRVAIEDLIETSRNANCSVDLESFRAWS
jgi:hypothetical protein